ncbi:FG-GAP repeat domain-containing protein [Kitasatospora aureofaciens]|uniref:FG-GAP repeat domain-containing protein n=1 Tax=Kitasatospora aureofaciens TaxID=1894 RepID=UPI0036F47B7E
MSSATLDQTVQPPAGNRPDTPPYHPSGPPATRHTRKTTVSSPVQAQVATWDHIWDYNVPGVPDVASGYTALVNNGGVTSFQVPANVIQDGHAYGYGMLANDRVRDMPSSASTPACYFKVDLTPPTVTFPSTVTDTSKQFPPSGNGQTPQLYAGQSGGIPFTATDPNGAYTSGVVCLRWSFDPQLVDATWQCGSSMPTGQIQVTPGRWGTNVLYIQAEDNAGNLSPVAQYAFYAPWNPNSPAPTFGDITGDALPDILTADPNGDLRAYNIPATQAKAPLAAPKAKTPGGDSWANYRATPLHAPRAAPTDDLEQAQRPKRPLTAAVGPGRRRGRRAGRARARPGLAPRRSGKAGGPSSGRCNTPHHGPETPHDTWSDPQTRPGRAPGDRPEAGGCWQPPASSLPPAAIGR